jgi:hypothetical protein
VEVETVSSAAFHIKQTELKKNIIVELRAAVVKHVGIYIKTNVVYKKILC